MKNLLKSIYFTLLMTILFTVSINGQTELLDKIEKLDFTNEKAQIVKEEIKINDESVSFTKDSELKKIEIPKIKTDESFRKDKRYFPPPKQNQGYVRPTKKQRFKLYLNRTIGTGLIGVTASSIVQQAAETPPEWEQNGKGFARRFGSNLATQAISETIAYGLEESLKLDSKFYKSKKKDFGSRVKNAFLSSFTARRPNGKRVFNPSRIAGRYTAEIIATETWFPERYSYKDGVRRATRGIGFNIGFNFLREFIFPE